MINTTHQHNRLHYFITPAPHERLYENNLIPKAKISLRKKKKVCVGGGGNKATTFPSFNATHFQSSSPPPPLTSCSNLQQTSHVRRCGSTAS